MTIESKRSRILAKQIVWKEGEEDSVCDTLRVRISLKREEIIGKGSFGVVQTVNITKITNTAGEESVPDGGMRLAMKTIKVRRRDNRELTILKQIYHKNIVKLSNSKESGDLRLNLLFAVHRTSLFHLIDKYYTEECRMPCSDLVSYGSQILAGLEYLHHRDIAHRDIKPRNLLLDIEDRTLQICDLGSACRVDSRGDLNPYICSRYYRAPELLLGSTCYSPQVDIWSFGCVLGEMGLLTPLIPGEDTGDQIGEVMELLGPPSSQDLQSMGLQDSGLFKTVGALEHSIAGVDVEERILKLLAPVETEYSGLPSVLYITLQYNPVARPTPSQLLLLPFFSL